MIARVLGLASVLFAAMILMGSTGSSRTALETFTSAEHPEVWELQVAQESLANVSWGRLELLVDLPVGSQVELWACANASEEPWASADQSGLLDVWIVDGRTGAVVQFDLTRTMRGEAVSRTFLIRVVDPEAGALDLRETSVSSVLEVRR